jgi:PAS domain S-box-containing protein
VCDLTGSYDRRAMPSQWLAVVPGVDPRVRARLLRQSWERLLAGRELKSERPLGAAAEVRQAIVDSWKRSLDTGLDPVDLLAPLEADQTEMRERWAEHPLGSLGHVLLDRLKDIASDCESLIVVSDASGLLLHIEGPETLRQRAAEMNFVEGARYSEAAAGTNGIGTVLAADHALQVFASEHFNQRHHGWTCSGAPVHDPVSGRAIGVVDLSSPWEAVHPLSLELATNAARALEQCLADARLYSDARLRRRYAHLATRATDFLVSPDGYVIAGERVAAPPKPLAIPEGGGEILLGDGSFAAAEPLGHGEAYLVRRIGLCAVGAAPTEALERAGGGPHEEARGHLRYATAESGGRSAESDRRVSAYFEAALDCVIMADASGRVVEFNPAAERTFGYTRDEALGRTMAELIVPPSLRERHSTAFARFVETRQGSMLGRRLELTGMRADGSEFPVELALSQVEAEPFLIFGALRDISAAKQAESHLRELADEQAALRRVATLVARESSPQQVFAVVAEQVAQIINVPLVRLVRYESDGSLAELIGGFGESVDPLAIGARWQLDGPGVLASVWRSGRPARLDDYTDLQGQVAAVVRQAGMRSAVASPISVEGRLWGAIAVLSSCWEPLPESTEARLADFTELVATALANAESRAELAASEARARKLAEEQAALRRVATLVAHESSPDEIFALVAEEVGQVLCVPIVALVRYETDGSAMRVVGGWSERAFPVPMGTRLLLDGPSHFADVWATGCPARLDDPTDLPGEIAAAMRQAGVGSGAASPILVEGRIWGAMAMGLFGSSDRLPDDIAARLADFTELLATAIANSEARDGLRRLLDEQAALRRVAILVAEGASASHVFSAVAREVAGVIRMPVVGVHRYETDGTFTMVGIAGDTTLTVGSRWPVEDEGLAGMIRASGRPARKDDYSTMPGPLGAALRDDRMASRVGVPIVVDGNVWGFMVAGGRPGEPIPASTEEHLARFTELVATAASNATIRADLIASRARVVGAADETRRRIERDLHDGAQQQLVTLALGLRAAEGRVPAGLGDLRAEVGRFADRLTSVIEELREMSRGIHPAILTEGGLSPAFEALALRSSVPVKLNARCEGRLPAGVEVAVYYVAAEALTNAAKHANASHVQIDLYTEEETLRLSILDDGVGGADPSGGTGLIGLKDRVEALGGAIEVKSPPRGGTRLDVEIPLIADRSADSASQGMSRV